VGKRTAKSLRARKSFRVGKLGKGRADLGKAVATIQEEHGPIPTQKSKKVMRDKRLCEGAVETIPIRLPGSDIKENLGCAVRRGAFPP